MCHFYWIRLIITVAGLKGRKLLRVSFWQCKTYKHKSSMCCLVQEPQGLTGYLEQIVGGLGIPTNALCRALCGKSFHVAVTEPSYIRVILRAHFENKRL